MTILRGQIEMLRHELLYERHKREQHAQRNRRLLSRTVKTTALQEQNIAMVYPGGGSPLKQPRYRSKTSLWYILGGGGGRGVTCRGGLISQVVPHMGGLIS